MSNRTQSEILEELEKDIREYFRVSEDHIGELTKMVQQLEEEKKHLQERICNQRRQLRVLHAMYEWALGRLQKAKLNDRAHFQAFLRERGYDLETMELPESKYQQLERERDAAVEQLKEMSGTPCENCDRCRYCKHFGECIYHFDRCNDCIAMECPCVDCANAINWQWRGVPEVE